MASFQEITGNLRSKLESLDPNKLKNINAVYQFDLSGDNGGIFHVSVRDGNAPPSPPTTSRHAISMFADDFNAVLTAQSQFCFYAGKLKVKGDMSGLKLQGLLG